MLDQLVTFSLCTHTRPSPFEAQGSGAEHVFTVLRRRQSGFSVGQSPELEDTVPEFCLFLVWRTPSNEARKDRVQEGEASHGR